MPSHPQPFSRSLVCLLASAPLLLAGCSNLAKSSPSSTALATQVTIKGQLHGGNQPVSGATVTVYYAGQSGYGSLDGVAATTTTANDGAGSFRFALTCPPATQQPFNPLVYLIARGGNTLNNGSTGNNNAAVFLAALAPCSQITDSTFVDMSEVTTVATMAALQQYFDPATEQFGVDGILLGYTAMANSMNLIPNLVNYQTGEAVSSLVKTATVNGSSIAVTVTPEQAKINTLANILSACINNNAAGNATACNTLFADAVPPSPGSTSRPGGTTFSPATDVLQALYYMLTNPTNGSASNLSTLYGLAPATGAPYQPTLATAPSDWTVGVSYSSSGTCSNGGGFIDTAYDLKIDASGAVWIDNGPASNANLAHMTYDGTPIACAPVANGSQGSTIDSQGNVWVGSATSNTVYRYTPGTGAILAYATASPVLSLTADGTDNVFFSTTASSLYEIAGGATATSATAPTLISSTLGAAPAQIMVDPNGNIFATTGAANISWVAPANGGSYTTSTIPASGSSYGLSLAPPNNSGTVFVASQSGSVVDYLGPNPGTPPPPYSEVTNFPVTGGGINSPTAISIDGARNLWLANNANGVSSVSEIGADGTLISPASGFAKSPQYLANGRSIIVDISGNVWISRDGATSITQIVGAGVPLYQPAAIGLQQGRFQTLP